MARSTRNCDREGDKATNDTLRVLKSENRQLRKQIAQLRRQLQDNDIDENPETSIPTPEAKKAETCGDCGGLVVTIAMGVRDVCRCVSCGKKWTVKNKGEFLK